MPVGRVPDGRHIMPLSGVAVVDAPNCDPYRNWLLIVAKYRKPGSALSASAIEREYTNLSSIAPTPPPRLHTHTHSGFSQQTSRQEAAASQHGRCAACCARPP